MTEEKGPSCLVLPCERSNGDRFLHSYMYLWAPVEPFKKNCLSSSLCPYDLTAGQQLPSQHVPVFHASKRHQRNMSDNGPSELPVFYGQRTADGELVKRQSEDNALGIATTPSRAHVPRGNSFDRVSMPPSSANPGYEEWEAPARSVRHRPSARSHHVDDSKGSWERPEGRGSGVRASHSSRRPLRREHNDYDDYDYPRGHSRYEREDYRDRSPRGYFQRREREGHPDSAYESSRPPRSYRNRETEMRRPRAYTYESERRSERRDPYSDDEREYYDYRSPPKTFQLRRPQSEESIDGYNYDGPKRSQTLDFNNMTKEQKAEILRLPLTHWMNSNFKNREFKHPSILS